jgi:hypothetical protein
MSITSFIIICILVLITLNGFDSLESFVTSKRVCNSVDNHCYKVVGKYNHTDEASKLLAYLNMFSIKLMRHLRKKYVYNNSEESRKVFAVKYLLKNYNPDNIIENAPISDVNTSYVDDKGKVFALCLREKASGENNFHTKELLEFVTLHEMSHMATTSFGHELEFWETFKFIIKEAELANLHIPVNYKKYPIVYCSLKVDYNPYFDNTLNDI